MERNKFKIPGLGMRTIKTAVSVVLCVAFFEVIDINNIFHISESSAATGNAWAPFYACAAAIICLQGTALKSLKLGIVRLIGTAIGGLSGILLLLPDDYLGGGIFNVFVIGFGIIICIFVSNITKQQDASAIACVVFVAILLNHSENDRYLYAVLRMCETAVGIMIAVFVNKFFNKPKFLEKNDENIEI